MCFSVTNLAILRGFRVPDAIIAYYPPLVIELNKRRFFPSNLLGIDDVILSKNLTDMFRACFLHKAQSVHHSSSPLISPLYAPDAMLRRLPPVEFFVSENDYERDDSLAMGLRILKAGGRCHITMMKDYIHAFQTFTKGLKIDVEEYCRTTPLLIERFSQIC